MAMLLGMRVGSLLAQPSTTTPPPPPPSPPPRLWHGSADASASFLLGNTDQRSVLTRGDIRHVDRAFEFKASLSFVYADTRRDTMPRYVSRRSWLGAASLDYRPRDAVSPFLFASYETSYEKRLLDRIGLGLGGKLTFVETRESLANISLAVLEERTRPSRQSTNTAVTSVPRWSGRVRFRFLLDSLVTVAHTTFYQPRLTRANIYTVTSTTDVIMPIRKSMSFKLSYVDLYDSQARSRGARQNNDAQILFGVHTEF